VNQEQVKSALRWVLTTGGGYLLALAVQKGWFTADNAKGIASLFSSEFVVGLISAGGALIWSMIAKTAPNLVSTVDNLPQVEGVITKPTEEGKELAKAVPSSTVVPAGTTAAKSIAS
jgi:hypothetical protein